MSSQHSALIAEGIEKSYTMSKTDILPVLKGIDLDIREGEIVAVMGPSGVGKSTLLHILGVLDRPDTGRVVLDGTDVFEKPEVELASFRNEKVGFVFQFHHLLPEFTALENTAMPGLIGRRSQKEVYEKAGNVLEIMGLQDRLQHRPSQLSGGELQRVAFARALINDPSLILADEPSGNLDRANSLALHEMMWQHVRELGKSFVIVTHNQELADQADRIIELFDGRVKDSA